MKTILVLHTGGTISMSKVAGGSVAPNEKNPHCFNRSNAVK